RKEGRKERRKEGRLAIALRAYIPLHSVFQPSLSSLQSQPFAPNNLVHLEIVRIELLAVGRVSLQYCIRNPAPQGLLPASLRADPSALLLNLSCLPAISQQRDQPVVGHVGRCHVGQDPKQSFSHYHVVLGNLKRRKREREKEKSEGDQKRGRERGREGNTEREREREREKGGRENKYIPIHTVSGGSLGFWLPSTLCSTMEQRQERTEK
ncbi:AF4/FMR2 family member 4, partial [Ophiophagus hannah]